MFLAECSFYTTQKKMQKFALEEPNTTVEIQSIEYQVAKNDLRVVK
jgi:hypothetical protein